MKRAVVGEPFLRVAAWQLLLGGLPLLVLSAALEGPIVWAPTFVALLLFLALVGTAFTTAAWYWLVQREEVGRLSLVLFLVPVLGLGIAAARFGERVGGLAAAGVVLALAATFVAATDALHASRARESATTLRDVGGGLHEPLTEASRARSSFPSEGPRIGRGT